LRAELRAGLTEEGWQHADTEPLARAALARAAITCGAIEQATFATAFDYLTCAATVGHAQPGFAARLAPQLGAGALMPDAIAADTESERQRERQRSSERAAAASRLRFEADREQKAAFAVAARESMGRTRDAERQAIARALTRAGRELRGARSPDALDAAWHAAGPYIEQARSWKTAREQAEGARAAQADLARQQRAQEREAKRTQERRAKELASEQQRAAAAELRAIGMELRRLEGLAKQRGLGRETPLQVLPELRLDGQPILWFKRPQLDGKFGAVMAALGPLAGMTGFWECPAASLALPGAPNRCEELASWEMPATQRVLEIVLAHLRDRRHTLEPQARKARRATRAGARGSPSRSVSASSRRPRAGRKGGQAGQRASPAPPDKLTCRACGAVYRARVPVLGRVLTCPRCNAPSP
jgi:hypothetical protein